MILIEPTNDGWLLVANHSNLYARMDGLTMALSNVPSNLALRPAAGRLHFVREAPTVSTVTTDVRLPHAPAGAWWIFAQDPRRVTIALVDGLASQALVAEVLRLLRDEIVPPDFLVEITATQLVLTNPRDSTGGPKSAGLLLPPRDWPTRDRELPRPQPTSEP